MQTPNRPYTIEQSDHSGGLKPEPGAVPPFPWKTLVGICVTIFAGIILIGYFFIQGMTDYFDGTVSSETESEDATKTVEPKPTIEFPEGALVFKAKDNSASKVDVTCGENREKANTYYVVFDSAEAEDCEVTIYMGRRDRKKFSVPNVVAGVYTCSETECLLENDE